MLPSLGKGFYRELGSMLPSLGKGVDRDLGVSSGQLLSFFPVLSSILKVFIDDISDSDGAKPS